ncbi:MAG TPA: hypothetical protein DDY22_17895, partial [Geobacter sp.]|nr:hypothetical protein [Geobacter sp.]
KGEGPEQRKISANQDKLRSVGSGRGKPGQTFLWDLTICWVTTAKISCKMPGQLNHDRCAIRTEATQPATPAFPPSLAINRSVPHFLFDSTYNQI